MTSFTKEILDNCKYSCFLADTWYKPNVLKNWLEQSLVFELLQLDMHENDVNFWNLSLQRPEF